MKPYLNKLFFILFLIIVQSCASLKTTYDYDRAVDFTHYKTFNYISGSPLAVSELVKKRIIASVTKNLETKGLILSENPDLIVDLIVKTEEKQQTSAITTSIGGSLGRRFRVGTGFSTTQVNVDNYTEGTLFVDIADRVKDELVWEGRGTTTITKSTTGDEKIEIIVNKILTQFPPTKK